MKDDELTPAALPGLGQRSALRILHLFGWRLRFTPLPGPHGVAIVYPHTSNWDFAIGLLGKWALGLPFRWLGKDSLFRGPWGALLRAWGGIATERGAPTGATGRLAAAMKAADWCWIVLAPEGTRAYRPNWRSGFYHLAISADVPLAIIYFDYPHKEIGVLDVVHPSGDPEADMAAVAAAYAGRHGKHPELEAPIVLAPPRSSQAGKQA